MRDSTRPNLSMVLSPLQRWDTKTVLRETQKCLYSIVLDYDAREDVHSTVSSMAHRQICKDSKAFRGLG